MPCRKCPTEGTKIGRRPVFIDLDTAPTAEVVAALHAAFADAHASPVPAPVNP